MKLIILDKTQMITDFEEIHFIQIASLGSTYGLVKYDLEVSEI
jgi:hypothetical protein